MTAVPFLLVVAVILPLLGWVSARAQQADPAVTNVSLRHLSGQIILVQGVVLGLAMFADLGNEHRVSWRGELTPLAGLLALGLVVLAVVIALAESRRPLGAAAAARRNLRRISGRDPTWLGVTTVAGVVEEYSYRGVLFGLLSGTLGAGPGALLSAACFGAGHLGTGWRAAAFAFGFALGMQALVVVSGGLLLAVFVHVAYDLAAAWLGHRLAAQAAGGQPTQ